MINVKFNNEEYQIEEQMLVIDFIKIYLKIDDKMIIACKMFNEVKSLNSIIDRNCKLELIDVKKSDGNRIYVRGLTFIFSMAFEELFPNQKYYVDYSLGHSLYIETRVTITEEIREQIRSKMLEIIAKDFAIEKKVITMEEAFELYKSCGKEDKRGLLETRMKTHVSLYYCNEFFNYFYGVMPISTSYIDKFDLLEYESGLLLVYPRRFSNCQIEKLKDTKKLYATFNEYDKIHKILGIETIVGLNRYIRENKGGHAIRISEALHEKKIANIADMIASDRNKKLVLIAGPSSSRKNYICTKIRYSA